MSSSSSGLPNISSTSERVFRCSSGEEHKHSTICPRSRSADRKTKEALSDGAAASTFDEFRQAAGAQGNQVDAFGGCQGRKEVAKRKRPDRGSDPGHRAVFSAWRQVVLRGRGHQRPAG